MRRSAAPSIQSSAKRLKFLAPFRDIVSDISIGNEKENNFDISLPATKLPRFSPQQLNSDPVPAKSSKTLSGKELFKSIFDPVEEFSVSTQNETEFRSLEKETYETRDDDTLNLSVKDDCTYFNVMWCKRSMKKHKIWEGDGILIIKKCSAILKDMDGKEIDRGMGYKLKDLEALEDGSRFFIGGKECEIQNTMSAAECKLIMPTSNSEKNDLPMDVNNSVKKPFYSFANHSGHIRPSPLQNAISYLQSSKPVKNSPVSASKILQPEFKPSKHDLLNDIFGPEDEVDSKDSDNMNAMNISPASNYSGTGLFSKSHETKNCGGQSTDHTFEHLDVDSDYLPLQEKSLYYKVMWCKRTPKKHKIWEGDGILIVKNLSAVLKNMEGKVIDRGVGYKIKEIKNLEEGSKFFVGGKECEIQEIMSFEEYEEIIPLCEKEIKNSNDQCQQIISTMKSRYPPLKFANPLSKFEGNQEIVSEDEFILPCPSVEHNSLHNINNMLVTQVKVDRFLANQLRPHQKEGIAFMYKCLMGFQHEYGEGVILADEMGLGKTLQCIALIWTLFKQGPYDKAVLKSVIIITPSSLVTNWKKEFHKWLGERRLGIYAVDKKNTIKNFLKRPQSVLLISYEMFLRSANLLSSSSFDLVICDEGHRIKNLNVKISNVVNCLSTSKRILLTGTPIQNDLAEFFSIIEFVNPGTLGSLKSFRRYFETPIVQSRNQDCSEEEREIGKERTEELNSLCASFMLRRTQEVINQFLPPKTEIIVFCRPTDFQISLYKRMLNSKIFDKMFSKVCVDSSLHLIYIANLRKLCNHPGLLYTAESSDEDSILSDLQPLFTDNYSSSFCDSGKMKVLVKMLTSLFLSKNKEKIVIVSSFTKTLDILEKLCNEKSYLFLRLDGSTPTMSRQELVDVFNKSYTKYNVFLLSSKAGGVGLNLIGASRIILYDVDWNPANDLQAMSRIWRDGQKHAVYVYRLLTTGTIEEKIFQRQLSKQCLTGSILNAKANEKLKFSIEELKDLFTLHENTDCLTHETIDCRCLSLESYIMKQDAQASPNCLTQNAGMDELLNWRHVKGPINANNAPDFTIATGGEDVSFIFLNRVNSACKNP